MRRRRPAWSTCTRSPTGKWCRRPAGLDAGLLVGAEHVLVLAERLPFPFPLIEVQDAGGLEGKVRVAGEDPRPVLPGLQDVVSQPAAHGGRRGRGSDAAGCSMAGQLGAGPASHRRPARGGHLARQGLDRGHDGGGEHARPARARCVGQSLDALLAVPASPLAGRVLADAQPLSDQPVRRACRGEQHNP